MPSDPPSVAEKSIGLRNHFIHIASFVDFVGQIGSIQIDGEPLDDSERHFDLLSIQFVLEFRTSGRTALGEEFANERNTFCDIQYIDIYATVRNLATF